MGKHADVSDVTTVTEMCGMCYLVSLITVLSRICNKLQDSQHAVWQCGQPACCTLTKIPSMQ